MRLYDFAWPERFSSRASRHGVLCYFDSGKADDGPPLVMLHALGINFTQWRHVAQILAPQQRLIGIDMPGCGHSAKATSPLATVRHDRSGHRALDELGIERAMIAGHSFGGRITGAGAASSGADRRTFAAQCGGLHSLSQAVIPRR